MIGDRERVGAVMRMVLLLYRRRSVQLAICLLIALAGYLMSYPIAYRMLSGSDAEIMESVQYLELRGIAPSNSVQRKHRAWQHLNQYYFPPAVWLIDHTPARYPVLLTAQFVDVDFQIESNILYRDYEARYPEAELHWRERALTTEFHRRANELHRKHFQKR